MKTVYHILDARKAHHVPHKISMFNRMESPGYRQIFILTGMGRERGDSYAKALSDVSPRQLMCSSFGILLFLKMSMNVFACDVLFLSHSANIRLVSLFSILTAPLRRCAIKWICWGPGIEYKPGFLGWLGALVKRASYNSFDQIVCLIAPDAEMLTRRLRVTANVSVIPYLFDPCDHAVSASTKPNLRDGKTNILIGNSASAANEHIALFDLLSKFRNENIRVITFLNYSNKDRQYVARVVRRGDQLFKDHFLYYLNLVSRRDYYSVMRFIDMTILPQLKQAGGAAIYQTVKQRGIVVLNEAGRNKAWMSSLGIKTLSLGDLERATSLSEVMGMIPEHVREESTLRLNRVLDNRKLARQWKSVLLT